MRRNVLNTLGDALLRFDTPEFQESGPAEQSSCARYTEMDKTASDPTAPGDDKAVQEYARSPSALSGRANYVTHVASI